MHKWCLFGLLVCTSVHMEIQGGFLKRWRKWQRRKTVTLLKKRAERASEASISSSKLTRYYSRAVAVAEGLRSESPPVGGVDDRTRLAEECKRYESCFLEVMVAADPDANFLPTDE